MLGLADAPFQELHEKSASLLRLLNEEGTKL